MPVRPLKFAYPRDVETVPTSGQMTDLLGSEAMQFRRNWRGGHPVSKAFVECSFR